MALPSWWLIGWRNLGRNPRRTFITALGLAAGYFAVIFMVGFADGLKVELIDNGTSLMTGQIQIHSPRYRPDRSLYETLGGRRGADFEAMIRTAIRDPEVVAAAPRVYGAGLVSSGQATTAGMLMGIDPAREPGVSRLMESLWKGRAPAPATGELMIGAEMARQLELQVGDEVILVAPAAGRLDGQRHLPGVRPLPDGDGGSGRRLRPAPDRVAAAFAGSRSREDP